MAKLRNDFYLKGHIVMPNDVFRDNRLDLEALGILCTIACLPSGYELTLESVSSLGPDPTSLVERCLNRLLAIGYLVEQDGEVLLNLEGANV